MLVSKGNSSKARQRLGETQAVWHQARSESVACTCSEYPSQRPSLTQGHQRWRPSQACCTTGKTVHHFCSTSLPAANRALHEAFEISCRFYADKVYVSTRLPQSISISVQNTRSQRGARTSSARVLVRGPIERHAIYELILHNLLCGKETCDLRKQLPFLLFWR